MLNLADDGLSIEVHQLHAIGGDDREVAIGQEKKIAGVIEDRGDVGGHKVFVFSQADHRRGTIAGGNDLVRLFHCNNRNREDSGQFLHRFADCLFQRRTMAVAGFEKMFLYQVGYDLGVGFSLELVAFLDELFFQREIVFDDAVMHHHDISGAVPVGMGILFRRTAMGGPARVADAVGAVERLQADRLFEIAQLAFGAAHLQTVAIAGDRDSGRVVAAILQPP